MTMRRDAMIRKTIPAAVLAVCGVLAHPALAARIDLEPSLSTEGRWDSNIFNTSAGEESDEYLRVRPQLDLHFETARTKITLYGGLEFDRYVKNNELNDEPPTIDVGLSVDKPVQLSPRLSISPSVSYVETRNPDRRNLLLPGLTPGVPASETIITRRSKSRDYSAYLRFLYRLTPLVDVGLGGGASRRDLVEGIGEDSTSATGDATLTYRITPRFSSGVFFNTSSNSFDQSPSSRTYAGGWTGTYLLTQQSSVEARAGATYLQEDAAAGSAESRSWFPYGGLFLEYAGQRYHATLSGTYEISGTSSFGGTTKRGTITLLLRDQISERWAGSIGGTFQRNRSVDEPGAEDFNYASGNANLEYLVKKWAAIRLGGEIIRQRSKGLGGSDVDRESVYLVVELRNLYRLY